MAPAAAAPAAAAPTPQATNNGAAAGLAPNLVALADQFVQLGLQNNVDGAVRVYVNPPGHPDLEPGEKLFHIDTHLARNKAINQNRFYSLVTELPASAKKTTSQAKVLKGGFWVKVRVGRSDTMTNIKGFQKIWMLIKDRFGQPDPRFANERDLESNKMNALAQSFFESRDIKYLVCFFLMPEQMKEEFSNHLGHSGLNFLTGRSCSTYSLELQAACVENFGDEQENEELVIETPTAAENQGAAPFGFPDGAPVPPQQPGFRARHQQQPYQGQQHYGTPARHQQQPYQGQQHYGTPAPNHQPPYQGQQHYGTPAPHHQPPYQGQQHYGTPVPHHQPPYQGQQHYETPNPHQHHGTPSRQPYQGQQSYSIPNPHQRHHGTPNRQSYQGQQHYGTPNRNTYPGHQPRSAPNPPRQHQGGRPQGQLKVPPPQLKDPQPETDMSTSTASEDDCNGEVDPTGEVDREVDRTGNVDRTGEVAAAIANATGVARMPQEVHMPQSDQHSQYDQQLEMTNNDDQYTEEFVTPRGEQESVWDGRVDTVPHTVTGEDADSWTECTATESSSDYSYYPTNGEEKKSGSGNLPGRAVRKLRKQGSNPRGGYYR